MAENVEIGTHRIPGMHVDGAGTRARQHHMTRLKSDVEGVQFVRQPCDGGDGVAHRGAEYELCCRSVCVGGGESFAVWRWAAVPWCGDGEHRREPDQEKNCKSI